MSADFDYKVIADGGIDSINMYLPAIGSTVRIVLMDPMALAFPIYSIVENVSVEQTWSEPAERSMSDPFPPIHGTFEMDSLKYEQIDGCSVAVEFKVPDKPSSIRIGWNINRERWPFDGSRNWKKTRYVQIVIYPYKPPSEVFDGIDGNVPVDIVIH